MSKGIPLWRGDCSLLRRRADVVGLRGFTTLILAISPFKSVAVEGITR